jgi:hypothetical protein
MGDTAAGQTCPGNFTDLDDPAFLAERARVRGLLEYQPENSVGRAELERVYEAMTAEFCRRAGIAWRQQISDGSGGANARRGQMDNQARARLLAVEVLLAEPEELGNDALEGDLYILLDKLRAEQESRQAS